jgi:hypothetical protein
MYRVNAVTGDSFVVASTGGLTARNAGAPALGTNLLAAPVAGAAAATTWRKLEGAFNDDGVTGLPPAAGTPVTIPAVDGNGDNAVVITLAAVNPTDQMAIGDMVYITGSNLLKDGYYKVSNVGGGGADITVLTRQALDLKPAGVRSSRWGCAS